MKRFEYILEPNSLMSSNIAIREKSQIIVLLLDIIKYVSVSDPIAPDTPTKAGEIRLILQIDKMSRIFICSADRIFSIHFPFLIREDESGQAHIYHRYPENELDSIATSFLLALFLNAQFENSPMESFFDIYVQEAIDFGISNDLDVYWDFVKTLILFEPGYLRYDHDEEHSQDHIHPLDHLDLFFSSNTTFKLGLNRRIDSEFIVDLVNTQTNCQFIK